MARMDTRTVLAKRGRLSGRRTMFLDGDGLAAGGGGADADADAEKAARQRRMPHPSRVHRVDHEGRGLGVRVEEVDAGACDAAPEQSHDGVVRGDPAAVGIGVCVCVCAFLCGSSALARRCRFFELRQLAPWKVTHLLREGQHLKALWRWRHGAAGIRHHSIGLGQLHDALGCWVGHVKAASRRSGRWQRPGLLRCCRPEVSGAALPSRTPGEASGQRSIWLGTVSRRKLVFVLSNNVECQSRNGHRPHGLTPFLARSS